MRLHLHCCVLNQRRSRIALFKPRIFTNWASQRLKDGAVRRRRPSVLFWILCLGVSWWSGTNAGVWSLRHGHHLWLVAPQFVIQQLIPAKQLDWWRDFKNMTIFHHNITVSSLCMYYLRTYDWTTAVMILQYSITPSDVILLKRTATVPMFSPTLSETTLSVELWFQRNGEKMFRSALIDLNEKLRLHVEGRTTAGGCCHTGDLHVILALNEGRLQKTAFAFGLSWQVYIVIKFTRQVCKTVIIFPKWRSWSSVSYVTMCGSYWLQTHRSKTTAC